MQRNFKGLPKEFRLWHVGEKSEGVPHKGVISVAYTINPETRTIATGFSFCSPDDLFKRDKGKWTSTGRHTKHPIILPLTDEKPSQTVRKFLMDLFGEANTQKLWFPLDPKKERRKRLWKWYLTSAVLRSVVSAPWKAVKHFPFMYPWSAAFTFPLSWLSTLTEHDDAA